MDKILVTKSSMPTLDEYVKEISDIWDSHWLTNMGEKHIEFQKQLINYLDIAEVELFTNGHMALELSLQAFGFERGCEVITTPFTFASTTHAIVRNGLVPVFCDIEPDFYTIDADKIEDLITEKTCAIMPVHVYGNICNVEKIEKIAKKHNLKVIYDAAHTFGEKYKGKGVGSFGDASCFSFHATKVFNSIEGGATAYTDKRIGQLLYDLKNFGIHGPEEVVGVGANAKMNEFCAAMGLCNLRHVDEEISKREKVYNRYKENLQNIKGIRFHKIQSDVKPNFAYMPVIFDEEFGFTRDQVYEALAKENIIARKYFYPLISDYDCYSNQYDSKLTPVAKEISNKVLTLPMYADLSLEDVDRICEIIINMKK